MKGYIYYIKNNETGKQYIGSTTDLKRRIRQHLCITRYTDEWHKLLHEFPDNFTIGVHEVVEADDIITLSILMAEKETQYYEKYKKTTGVYNIVRPSISPVRGKKYSEERLIKQREAHYGREHKSSPNISLINTFLKMII